ncbi:hypothetical protein pb186bvf_021042 [Paramecium bursaria]
MSLDLDRINLMILWRNEINSFISELKYDINHFNFMGLQFIFIKKFIQTFINVTQHLKAAEKLLIYIDDNNQNYLMKRLSPYGQLLQKK